MRFNNFPDTISADSLALAMDAIAKSLTEDGQEATRNRRDACMRSDWGGYTPHHIAIQGSSYGDPVRFDVVGLSTKALEREDSDLFPVYAIAKKNMEELIREHTERTSLGLKRGGLVLRTSTLHTPSEGDMRAGADPAIQKYWISPEELVAATVTAIHRMPSSYVCLDVFKEKPDYDPEMHTRETARTK